MARTISHCQGKGSLTHNNRKFAAKNVDSSRTENNIIFVEQPIADAYDKIFGAAIERYNAKQKRSDRKIRSGYFEHVFKRSPAQSVVTSADKRKSFYEDVVQIGTMDDTGVGSPDGQIATECLTEYVKGFAARNPNFHVFFSALHLDERTPHLHIDYIPVGHYKQGVDTQNGLAQALKEMGYGTGKDAINRWRLAERAVLERICKEHGIEISAPEKSRGSFTVEQYKEYAELKEKAEEQRQEVKQLDNEIGNKSLILEWREKAIESAETELEQLGSELQEKRENAKQLGTELIEKSAALSETSSLLADNRTLLKEIAEKVSQIKDVDRIETGKTVFGGKVTVSQEDYGKLAELAKKQIAAENKENFLKRRIATLETEKSYLSSEKEQLTEQVAELKREKAAANSFDARIELAKVRSERDNLQRRLDKITEFIKSFGLMEKLQAFFHTNRREKHR